MQNKASPIGGLQYSLPVLWEFLELNDKTNMLKPIWSNPVTLQQNKLECLSHASTFTKYPSCGQGRTPPDGSTTFSIMTLSIIVLIVTLNTKDNQLNDTNDVSFCWMSHLLIVMLIVILLSGVIQSVTMLSVVAPTRIPIEYCKDMGCKFLLKANTLAYSARLENRL